MECMPSRTQSRVPASAQMPDRPRRADSLLELLGAATPDCIWIADAYGQPEFVNRCWEAFTGLHLQDIQVGDWQLPIHPDDRQRLAEAWVQAARRGRAFESELRLRARDGHYEWFWGRAVPFRDEDGRISHWVGIMTNIEARRRLERDLRHSEQRFRVLVEGCAQAVWEADAVGRPLGDSPSWRAFTGQTPAEWLDGGCERAVHPEDRPYVEQIWRDACEALQTFTVECRLRRADGEWAWTQISAAPILEDDGALRGWSGMNFDIRERRRIEAELRGTVARLTEESRRKRDFLSTLGHELRNPLAPIRNALQILKKLDLGQPTARRAVEMADRHLGRVLRLLDDLRDVSRIEHGKIELRFGRCEANELVTAALESCRPALEAKHLHLSVHFSAERLELDGDADRLVQVFSNLSSNAVRYTQEQGRIWITSGRSGNEAVISVRDSGVGIEPEALERIFEMFSQAAPVEVEQAGMGIGLALVRQLVRMHGGVVQARSEGRGRGSEFIVRLPLACRAD
jgi:PAS domain S-box-containing protein